MGMNMKRGLVVAGGLLMSLTLIACGSDDDSVKANDGKFSGGYERANNSILIDNETGCQYIQSKSSYSLTTIPRLDENGKPMCGKTKEEK